MEGASVAAILPRSLDAIQRDRIRGIAKSSSATVKEVWSLRADFSLRLLVTGQVTIEPGRSSYASCKLPRGRLTGHVTRVPLPVSDLAIMYLLTIRRRS